MAKIQKHIFEMGIIEDRKEHLPVDQYDKERSKEREEMIQNAKAKNPLNWLYYSIFAILIFILIVQVGKSVEYYLEKPTYTESHLVRQYHADFPAMSICSDSGGFKEEVLQVLVVICVIK